ncbi:hypothetical protein BGX38DRAFT_1165702 [Terfezia claveryi]|nr:hypothetical protein BGX38DRAFT_1165702 [Terfezia claveryi]
MPIQMQFDILEARLDALYQKERLLALAPDLTPCSPALGQHRERGRQLKQRLASVKFEMSLVQRAFFYEVREPLREIEESAALNMPMSSRIDTIRVRIEDGERYLIIYDHVFNKTTHRLWNVLLHIQSYRSSSEFRQMLHSLIRWDFSVDGRFLACFENPKNEVSTGNPAIGLAREGIQDSPMWCAGILIMMGQAETMPRSRAG